MPTPQFGIVVLRLRTALHFACAVFRVFAPLSPVSPAHSPLAARGYGPAYFRASPSKLPGPSRPLASLTAARCSGAADALWAWPQFGMVVPHRSQARLRLSLVPTIRNSRLATLPLASLLCSLDFRFACFAHCARRSSVPQGARFVRPSRLQPLRGLRLCTALRSVCSPLQPFGPPMFASSLAVLPASLGSSTAIAPSIRNGRPAAPYGLQYSLAHWAYYGLFRALRAAKLRPHWAYYGLFPPQAAAFVRPSVGFAASIPQFSMVVPHLRTALR